VSATATVSVTTTPAGWRWLVLLALCLIPIFFHGCHLGGHDEDLLFARPPWLLHSLTP